MNGENGGKRFYGKYRGVVINNVDPEQKGRIQVEVSDPLGVTPTTWAWPAVPLAGIQSGVYVVPTLGSGVWVEFEHGDRDKPIWSGCWWGSAGEVPTLALAGIPATPNIVLQTPGQNTLVLSDVPAVGITLKTKLGAMIVINDAGILLSNGKGATIMLASNAVTVNAGALVVT
jgi:uncharacterized protein involved in type VI secretion and phage assembly